MKNDNFLRNLLNKYFKGNVVNLALPSFHGGSLDFTLTVPFKKVKVNFNT